MHKLLLIIGIFLSACTATGPGGITSVDSPDTYKLALEGEDSLLLHENIVKQADSFCQNKGLYFMPAAKKYNESSYEMTFRCLDSGDPELVLDDKRSGKKKFHKKLGGYGDVSY